MEGSIGEASPSAVNASSAPFASGINGANDVSPSTDGTDGLLGKGVIDDLPQRKILLTKGVNGLGFNIRGGIDAPYVKSDKGIFIVKIHRDGAAFKDGRLRVGDKILSLNGVTLDGLRHEEVVSQFLSAGDVVRLHVLQGAGPVLKEFESLLQSSVKLQRKNQASPSDASVPAKVDPSNGEEVVQKTPVIHKIREVPKINSNNNNNDEMKQASTSPPKTAESEIKDSSTVLGLASSSPSSSFKNDRDINSSQRYARQTKHPPSQPSFARRHPRGDADGATKTTTEFATPGAFDSTRIREREGEATASSENQFDVEKWREALGGSGDGDVNGILNGAVAIGGGVGTCDEAVYGGEKDDDDDLGKDEESGTSSGNHGESRYKFAGDSELVSSYQSSLQRQSSILELEQPEENEGGAPLELVQRRDSESDRVDQKLDEQMRKRQDSRELLRRQSDDILSTLNRKEGAVVKRDSLNVDEDDEDDEDDDNFDVRDVLLVVPGLNDTVDEVTHQSADDSFVLSASTSSHDIELSLAKPAECVIETTARVEKVEVEVMREKWREPLAVAEEFLRVEAVEGCETSSSPTTNEEEVASADAGEEKTVAGAEKSPSSASNEESATNNEEVESGSDAESETKYEPGNLENSGFFRVTSRRSASSNPSADSTHFDVDGSALGSLDEAEAHAVASASVTPNSASSVVSVTAVFESDSVVPLLSSVRHCGENSALCSVPLDRSVNDVLVSEEDGQPNASGSDSLCSEGTEKTAASPIQDQFQAPAEILDTVKKLELAVKVENTDVNLQNIPSNFQDNSVAVSQGATAAVVNDDDDGIRKIIDSEEFDAVSSSSSDSSPVIVGEELSAKGKSAKLDDDIVLQEQQQQQPIQTQHQLSHCLQQQQQHEVSANALETPTLMRISVCFAVIAIICAGVGAWRVRRC